MKYEKIYFPKSSLSHLPGNKDGEKSCAGLRPDVPDSWYHFDHHRHHHRHNLEQCKSKHDQDLRTKGITLKKTKLPLDSLTLLKIVSIIILNKNLNIETSEQFHNYLIISLIII